MLLHLSTYKVIQPMATELTKLSKGTEAFREILIKYVRDDAVENLRSFDKLLPGVDEEIRNQVISRCVDETIFRFLLALDGEGFNVTIDVDGVKYDLNKENGGEFAGYYAAEWSGNLGRFPYKIQQ